MKVKGRNIVVIGASAGGLQALIDLLGSLPPDYPGSIFIAVHTAPDNPGILPSIVRRTTTIPVGHASDGEIVEPGRIYIAPPDHHLLVKGPLLRVFRGPKENGFRPAVDPLFRSASRSCGARVVGILLSGGLNDGSHGMMLINEHGGLAVVQDPEEAVVNSMPRSALEHAKIDHVLPAAEIGRLLAEIVHVSLPEGTPHMCNGDGEPDELERADAMETGAFDGPPSSFTCPECGGTLWERTHGSLVRFRCHVGHAYTAESLMADQTVHLEIALASAVRALEENAALHRRLAERAREAGLEGLIISNERKAADSSQRADVIREVLQQDLTRDDTTLQAAGSQADATAEAPQQRSTKKRK